MSSLSLWLQPEPPVAAVIKKHIDALASLLGTQTFAPHVTVIGGFGADEDEAVRMTKDLARSVVSTEVRFDAAGFEDVLVRAAYLKARPSASLNRLRYRAGELFQFPPEPYMPHMSLAYSSDVSEDARRTAVDALAFSLPMMVRFTSIGLWRTELDYNNPDFSAWAKLTEVPLSNAGGATAPA